MNSPGYRDRNQLEIFAWPEVSQLVRQLSQVIMAPGELPAQLKSEAFTVLSLASGCRHCQAHGAYGLHVRGTEVARIQALWDFERSDLFTEAEREVLRLARDAGVVPNAVTAEHFEALRRHFNERQIQELLGVVAISGLFNRYSDTLAVVTDQESVDWAREFIAPVGWELGKHEGAKCEQRTAAPFGPRAFKSLVPGADH